MIALEKKNTSKSPDYNQFLFKKMFEVSKKPIFSGEKNRNSSYCIYDYAHSFSGEDP